MVLFFVLSLTGCGQKAPAQESQKEAEKPRYVDPLEAQLPRVSEGYYYHELPKEYKLECKKQGSMELLTYTSLAAPSKCGTRPVLSAQTANHRK